MIKKLNRLAHPVFLVSLFILFFNDLILKTVFNNYLTGKLSDFAGLLAFPFFWSVLFPKRTKEIHIAVALFFIFWKSPFSEDFVDFFGFYRVVDFSDFIAFIFKIQMNKIIFKSIRARFLRSSNKRETRK